MLLYSADTIAIYACFCDGASPFTRRETELAKRMLLEEAFPDSFNGIEIMHRPDGSPYLSGAGSRYRISITHSRRTVALALSAEGSKIGIDTETPDRIGQLHRVASRFLAPDQSAYLRSDNSLLLSWTIKEALYKAMGMPGWALAEIPLPHTPMLPARVSVGETVFSLRTIALPNGNGVITLAVEQP